MVMGQLMGAVANGRAQSPGDRMKSLFSANSIEDLKKPTVTYGGIKFEVRELLTMESVDLLDYIIERAVARSSSIMISTDSAAMSLLLAVMSLPAPEKAYIRSALFKHVVYTDGQGVSDTLAENEDHAFEKLEAFHVYAVLARALVVNFLPSWNETVSRMETESSDSTEPSTPTSTRSSRAA